MLETTQNKITLKAKVMHKHETEENWEVSNYVPRESELVFYDEDDNHDYKRFKIGDGNKKVKDLPFSTGLALQDGEGENSIQSPSSIAKGQHSSAIGESDEIQLTITSSTEEEKTYKYTMENGMPSPREGCTFEYNEETYFIQKVNQNAKTITLDKDFEHLGNIITTIVYNIAQGQASHAEGSATKTTGDGAHSEGRRTEAGGHYSHAENYYTIATGTGAHAEGGQTEASGNYSHAEGLLTVAEGANSHSEGHSSIAKGPQSHAEGQSTQSNGWTSHAEGHSSISEGQFSHAEGKSAQARGRSSHAEGEESQATGMYSHSEGYKSLAQGNYSHSEGSQTQSTANYSHSEGSQSKANGSCSHAEGCNTQANGANSHAEGNNTVAGDDSHAEGNKAQATGYISHAEGYNTLASGAQSHAEGHTSQAIGVASHAEGSSVIAKGTYSHAEGSQTQSLGTSSHAEGYGTVTGDAVSVKDSNELNLKGYYAHAEGVGTKASGVGSHSEGRLTEALGNYSHAEGYGTLTDAGTSAQHAEGRFNKQVGNTYAHVVGNGTDRNNRSNAHTLDWDGNAWFAGKVIVGGTSQEDGEELATKQHVSDKIDEFHNLISTNEFNKSKLPTKIYYKVIEPEWVNSMTPPNKNESYEVSSIEYTKEGVSNKSISSSWDQYGLVLQIDIPANTYYTTSVQEYEYSTGTYIRNLSDFVNNSLNTELRYVNKNNNKIVLVSTTEECYHGCTEGEAKAFLTTYKYEDGSSIEAPLILCTEETVECYDFENLQFTTEAEGNTLLGNVYSYIDEWGNRCYTLYPDYTPNIKEGTNAIKLDENNKTTDPENMLYTIKLEALFNGGYKFSLGNKDFSFLGGKDVVADGDGAFSSGTEIFVTGLGTTGIGMRNRVRSRNGAAIGYNNIVTGKNAVALNEGNKVFGYAATGFGDHNITLGYYDIIGGWQNKSRGYANLGQGAKNVLDGEYILGLGSYNIVKGKYVNAQGNKNEINGNYNDINGVSNILVGNNNVISGLLNKINSSNNKVYGSENSTVASADFNIINGQKNQVNAPESVNNFINGVGNIIEPSPYTGQKNYGYCVLIGRYNTCKSSYGYGHGTGLIVDGLQFVLGKYNEVDRYANIIVGGGSSDTQRKNIFVVKNDGRVILGADPKDKMDAVTKQYVDDKIGQIDLILDTIIKKQNELIGGDAV